ncbi:hypothetical protein KM620_gp035 [Hyposidra talaca nucleopolyhedrovirus]|uniref:Uncharacterized protein n=1 Tax=Hyposidra talaca nucleopolyhedrovirus TaxID=1070315 RepID=A0A2Z4HHZ2_9ABAC|nr:hypothetical protein KM620_gp035 [Hyposidra talaca nucleopolyhedrovirus]AWW14395.1 hypothetical protein HytaNPV_gp035 [Hyposidra talaca nucleopolyhedrovirus]
MLQINDVVTVTILATRLYKLHVVNVHNTYNYNAILIANKKKSNKIYCTNQVLQAKIIRIDDSFVDLVPL